MLTVFVFVHQQDGIHADVQQRSVAAATSVCWLQWTLVIQMDILVTVLQVFSCFMIRGPAIQQVPVGFVYVLPTSFVYFEFIVSTMKILSLCAFVVSFPSFECGR